MNKLILAGILVLAFILRVFSLDSLPAGFTPDEASFGYDAYSILKTGKDQWGNSFPLVLKSFGDYKAPLYSYLAIPFVAMFGLSEFSVRLPNALLGSLAVYIVYLLVKQMFGKSQTTNHYAVITALLLAISPWHIMMSRGAFEANLTTFLMPLAILFFVRKKYLYSSLFFGLNLFSYHSAKLVVPIIIFSLIVLYWNDLKNYGYKNLISSGVVLFLAFFLSAITFIQGAGSRAAEINIFNGALDQAYQERFAALDTGVNPKIARLLHNKYTVYMDRFSSNYLQYFSPQFLLTEGARETTYGMYQGRGVVYWFEFLGLLLFIAFFYKYKNNPLVWVVLIWLLVAPVPASLTTGPGHAGNRAVIMLPALQILSGIGLYYVIAKSKYLKYLMLGFVAISILMFSDEYFNYSKFKGSKGMLYGNIAAAKYVKENYPDEKIYVSRNLSEPHIYFAFIEMVPPKDFQKDSLNWSLRDNNVVWVDQIPEYSLGRFTFTDTRNIKSGIVITREEPKEYYKNYEILETIEYPDYTPSIYLLRVNDEE